MENAIAKKREMSVFSAYVFTRNIGEVFGFFVLPVATVLSLGTKLCSS